MPKQEEFADIASDVCFDVMCGKMTMQQARVRLREWFADRVAHESVPREFCTKTKLESEKVQQICTAVAEEINVASIPYL